MKKYDKAMIDTADIWSLESYCKRKQVGAVLSYEGRIISVGYNGTVTGSNNTCECNKGKKTKLSVVHAEANAILFAAKSGIKTDGCTLYVTLAPCMECSKMIIQCGIKEVIYSNNYSEDGIKFLRKCGVIVRKYKK